MYEFTPADPTRKRPGHEPPVLADKQRILFIYIPVVAFASVMSAIVLGNDETAGVVQLFAGIGVNVLALLWTRRDAEERSHVQSPLFALAVVVFGIFAIIYYLFRSRGWDDGLRATGWLLLYVFATSIVLMIASLIVTSTLVTVGVLPQNIFDNK